MLKKNVQNNNEITLTLSLPANLDDDFENKVYVPLLFNLGDNNGCRSKYSKYYENAQHPKSNKDNIYYEMNKIAKDSLLKFIKLVVDIDADKKIELKIKDVKDEKKISLILPSAYNHLYNEFMKMANLSTLTNTNEPFTIEGDGCIDTFMNFAILYSRAKDKQAEKTSKEGE